jgi:acyl-CoA dehydrogenase
MTGEAGTPDIAPPANSRPAAAKTPLKGLAARAWRAAAVAEQFADDVDRRGRHPAEAVDAMRAERLLSALAPTELGGEAAQLGDVAEVCYILGQACASSAMIYAMHQVKVACVVRHGLASAWQRRFLEQLSARQLLVASSTTEGKRGGDIRSSESPIETEGGRIRLVRDASVISYGADADVIITTARRTPDSAASDQVLAVFHRDDYTLEPGQSWDTLGMRGTCSAGFTLRAAGDPEQVLPQPYGEIHTQTMVPASHLLWSSVWAGVAAAAVERARRHTRRAWRGSLESAPSAPYLAKAQSALRSLRALIATSLDRYARLADDPQALAAVEFQSAINLLKVDASELAVAAALNALRACGLSGYRNDTDVSVGRHLRDLLSAPTMINNDRILQSVTGSTLLSEGYRSIRD